MRERTVSRGFDVVDGASMTTADVFSLSDTALSDLPDASQSVRRLCPAHLLRSHTLVRELLFVCRVVVSKRAAVCTRLPLQHSCTR